ncbi:MAG: Maf family protein [Lachnospiraceae bacterium]|nr:Maf family protein [Lachnospiraceae bacterium]
MRLFRGQLGPGGSHVRGGDRLYLATGEADDKAGAYGIQGAFGVYVAGIEGDYYNIVGLPISRLYQTMKEAGLLPELPG